MRLFAKIGSLILLFGVLESKAYNYENADKWGEDYPGCDAGYQSPIDIPNADGIKWFQYDKNLKLDWIIAIPKTMTLVNDGHSMKLLFTWQNEFIPYIYGGPLGDNKYQLDHLQFRWGTDDSSGSEHTINGEGAALELQCILYNSKYSSYADAADKNGGLAIAAGLFYADDYTSSYGLREVFKVLDHPLRDGDKINIKHLIPTDAFGVLNTEEFYTYSGSLTSPPCSKIVTWFINMEKRFIKAEEVEKLRKFVELNDGDDHNTRPVQPLGNRQIHRVQPRVE